MPTDGRFVLLRTSVCQAQRAACIRYRRPLELSGPSCISKGASDFVLDRIADILHAVRRVLQLRQSGPRCCLLSRRCKEPLAPYQWAAARLIRWWPVVHCESVVGSACRRILLPIQVHRHAVFCRVNRRVSFQSDNVSMQIRAHLFLRLRKGSSIICAEDPLTVALLRNRCICFGYEMILRADRRQNVMLLVC